MRLLISSDAQRSFDKIVYYLNDNYNKSVKRKFLQNFFKNIRTISDNPLVGKKEPLLENRKHEYRSLVINKLNKIVYYIKDDTIHVSDIWDTRQNPEILTGRIKD